MTDLAALERYYDAVPRTRADVEEVGPFTLFVARPGGWPYYARPRLGGSEPYDAADVAAVLDRMRELDVPLAIEWVHDITPDLLAAVRAEGTLEVLEAPLMVLQDGSDDPVVADEIAVRMLRPDEEDLLASVTAVQHLAFGPEHDPPAGPAERDDTEQQASEGQRAELRSGSARIAVAEHAESGILAAGQYLLAEGVAEIVGVATLPSAQGARLGSAVTAALVQDAHEHGIATVFLSAGAERVARIYARLGFARVGTAYVASAPSA